MKPPTLRYRLLSCLVPAAALLGGPVARAQQAPANPAVAEALFRAARRLVEAGDYAAACPKFEASLALQPSAGTMLNIAKCHEHDGRIARAWADYSRALVLNQATIGAERRRALERFARQGVDALEPRLPRLRVVIKSPPPGLAVQRDGAELPLAALGEALPADPGDHTVSVTAPGRRPETRAVTLKEGQTVTVEIALLVEQSIAPPVEPAIRVAGDDSPHDTPAWVWLAGGAGVALVGAGVYFLNDDLAATSALRSHCATRGGDTACTPSYDFASDNARKNRGFGLFLGLGGAGVAALGAAGFGLVRAYTSPPAGPSRAPSSLEPSAPPPTQATTSVWFAPDAAGAALSGSF